jgi:quinohemoprotein ethanol dehydrogenase
MSYSAQTHWVYIPVIDMSAVWIDMLHNGGTMKYLDGFFTVQGIFPDDTYDAAALKKLYGPLPDLQSIKATRKVKPVRELLRAWDPVAQKTVWEHETSSGIRGYDGGVMSTAGNLVFQGRGSGELWIYAADSGKVLKVIKTGSHLMAAPMTYSVNGEQYVAIQAGYGGAAITVGPIPPSSAALKYQNTNRIIAFRLGGGPVPTPAPRVEQPFAKPPVETATRAQIDAGELKFAEECSRCHVLGPSSTPDLRRLDDGLHATFKDIVMKGVLAPMGMERFDDILSEQDVDNIHAYLINQSWDAYRQQQAAAVHP